MKICIVIANYYPKISKDLLKGSVKELSKKGINNCKKIYAPGIFELPVIISRNINKFDAFVALGCVIKGQTPHFHYLCSSVINALTNFTIKSKKPIGNGILTCNNKKQALKRANPKIKDKGGDAALAVISVLDIIN